MRRLNEEFSRLLDDERGGDAIEYALMSGLIVILFLGAFISMTQGVEGTFNSVENAVTGA
ncbi:MAG: Flp family type IVb pilin [Pseudomonadota bacterium]